ncbi:MAG: hypothetical protein ACTSUN_02845 [Promethearchaeota archaeon]
MENASTETMGPRKFTIKERFYWGFASLGGSIISGIYASLRPIFYTDYLGLVESAGIIYIVSIIYAIWNAINDPLLVSFQIKQNQRKDVESLSCVILLLFWEYSLFWYGLLIRVFLKCSFFGGC